MKIALWLAALMMLTFAWADILCGNELRSGAFSFGQGKNQKGYLFLPQDFKVGGKYKFILFMHGRGAAPGTPGNFGSPEFAQFRKLCSQHGYVVAVPPLQSLWFNAASEKNVDRMLDFLGGKLKMDLSRFYVMGCSMGGMSALVYAGKNSERVIAICDIFGPADLKEFHQGEYKDNIKSAYGGSYEEKKSFYESRNPMNYISVLKNIPLLVIHGEKDLKVPVEESEKLIAAIKNHGGGQVELIKIPKLGHANKIINTLEDKIISFMNSNK